MTTFFFSGMGADERLFPANWLEQDEHIFCRWPKRSFESIPALADFMIQEHGISSADTVVGVSLGGMVALEIGVKLDCVIIMISSARNPKEIRSWLRGMRILIHPGLFRWLQILAPKWITLTAMIREADPNFLASMCRACLQWQGQTTGKVKRFHGKNDWIIRPPNEGEILPGGHLMVRSMPKDFLGP